MFIDGKESLGVASLCAIILSSRQLNQPYHAAKNSTRKDWKSDGCWFFNPLSDEISAQQQSLMGDFPVVSMDIPYFFILNDDCSKQKLQIHTTNIER